MSPTMLLSTSYVMFRLLLRRVADELLSQNTHVRRRRPTIRAEKVDSLLRVGDVHHLLHSAERVRPSFVGRKVAGSTSSRSPSYAEVLTHSAM